MVDTLRPSMRMQDEEARSTGDEENDFGPVDTLRVIAENTADSQSKTSERSTAVGAKTKGQRSVVGAVGGTGTGKVGEQICCFSFLRFALVSATPPFDEDHED